MNLELVHFIENLTLPNDESAQIKMFVDLLHRQAIRELEMAKYGMQQMNECSKMGTIEPNAQSTLENVHLKSMKEGLVDILTKYLEPFFLLDEAEAEQLMKLFQEEIAGLNLKVVL